jgi:hypothetical protein
MKASVAGLRSKAVHFRVRCRDFYTWHNGCICCNRHARDAGSRPQQANTYKQIRIRPMTAGSKMFWAMLWIIGLPLPLLVILWFLFGSR